MDFSANISIVNLNADSLIKPIKRQTGIDFFNGPIIHISNKKFSNIH